MDTMTTTGTDWAHVLNDRLRANITGPMRDRWSHALAAKFQTPPLTETEKESAALRIAEFKSNESGKYRHPVTLQDMEEQIGWSRNRATWDGGRKESPEDALAKISAEPCPFMRFSMIAAPSRRWMRDELLDRLRIAGVEVRSDIRNHPRFGMRPSRPADRDILAEIRERLRPVLDEDAYLREIESFLARVPLDRHPAAPPIMAAVINAAASGRNREERPRVPTWDEEAVR
jgi:hypothetical protein